MDKNEIRRRTKIAVAAWCGLEPSEISVDDKLDNLRGEGRDLLRKRVNSEFSGEVGFPISPTDWVAKDMETVSDVRDFVTARLGK